MDKSISDEHYIVSFEKRVASGFNSCGINKNYKFQNSNAKNTVKRNIETEKVECSEEDLKICKLNIGIAVSGGADSIALLTAVSRIFSLKNKSKFSDKKSEAVDELESLASLINSVRVITVNHNIREKEETAGDAEFVRQYCINLGIPCDVDEIPRGLVQDTAEKRGGGIEEAARFLRYSCFESFILKNNIDFVCLAHNRNDQLETVLQRFFQGAGSSSLGGIKRVREKYCRPLLDISRRDIEKYLTLLGMKWRTDATNFDNSYLRNRYRNRIMPLLDETIPGWDSAILSCADKADDDDEVISLIADKLPWEYEDNKVICGENKDTRNSTNTSAFMDRSLFFAQPMAVRIRLLFNAIDLIRTNKGIGRVPYTMLHRFSCGESYVSGSGIEISSNEKKICVRMLLPYRKASSFFAIIEETGTYSLPTAVLKVIEPEKGKGVCVSGDMQIGPFPFPFIIRSVSLSDEVQTADGGKKTLKKLFSDWHINESKKAEIPVIESFSGDVLAVWGSLTGYSNWFVKKTSEN